MELPIGRNVKKFRKKAGLTQEQLAGAADITLRYVQSIEDGSRIPIIITLLRIAAALKKNIKDFF